MNIKNVKIITEFTYNDTFQTYDIEARENGKAIFGASARVQRSKGFSTDSKWTPWLAKWGSCNSDSPERKQVEAECIKQAIELMLTLNK